MTLKTFTTLFGALVLTAVPFAAVFSQTPTSTSTTKNELFPYAPVSTDMVKEAGFSMVQAVPEAGGRFKLPIFYFTTQTVTTPELNAWGDAAGLVAVLIQPIKDQKWVFNQGDIQILELNGRFQANVSSPEYFISVTGPDKNKVTTLAHTLKVLY